MRVTGVIVVIFVLCGGLMTTSLKQLMSDEWIEFKLQHKKVYDTLSKEQHRYNVYLDNRDFIAKHNQRFALGLETYEMGVNHLADLTYEEVLQRFTGGLAVNLSRPEEDFYFASDDSEKWREDDIQQDNVDWRLRSYTPGPIYNQGQCGSCWAFSALSTLEYHLQIYKNITIQLSEQNLVDCTKRIGNNGCSGGNIELAYVYIQKYGIAMESRYRYDGRDGTCRYTSYMRAASIKGYKNIQGEENMMSALKNVGPLAAGIHASRGFVFYKHGIYNEPNCSKDINHAVVVVDHGNQDQNQFWKVQNSWGKDWGAEGYILMSKNKSNQCGITDDVNYPIV